MRNKPLSDSTRVFKREDIIYEQPPVKASGLAHQIPKDVAAVLLGVDPAGTKNKDSDFFASVPVAIRSNGSWVVLPHVNERIGNDISVICKKLIGQIKAWGIKHIALETNYFRGVLRDALRQTLDNAGLWAVIHERKGSAAMTKDHRILALQPLFDAHKITLNASMPALEHQLLNWRPGSNTLRHDDIIDALSWVKTLPQIKEAIVPVDEPLIFNSTKFVMLEIARHRAKASGKHKGYKAITGVGTNTINRQLPTPVR
jgi:phage terminase large subunit-like protein